MNEIAAQMYKRKIPPPPGTFLKPGVGVIILNSKNEILFEKRSDCGLWGLIGGKVDVGESVLETLHREILEETGLEVEILYFLGVYSGPEDRIVTYLDNGDVAQLLDLMFVVKAKSEELKISKESLELRFFNSKEIPQDIVPPAKKPLEDFLSGLKNVIK